MEAYQLDAFARDGAKSLAQLRSRLEALEHQVAALAPLRDSDRLAVAQACKQAGATLADLQGRAASPVRAKAANRVMRILRDGGWSLDRIARATGYSARGVASNLEHFSGK